MGAALTPALRLTGEGAPVELWLLHMAAARQRQREAVRAWLAGELLRRGEAWRSSFSYCGPYILCGLSRLGDPGVDLAGGESWTGDADVALLYCGPEAAAGLRACHPLGRADAFARIWSALEARLKACRRGLEEYSPERERRLAAARLTCQVPYDGLWASAALRPDAAGVGPGG